MYFKDHQIVMKGYLLHKHDPLYDDLSSLVDDNTVYVSSLKTINRKKLATMVAIGGITLTSLFSLSYSA